MNVKSKEEEEEEEDAEEENLTLHLTAFMMFYSFLFSAFIYA